MTTFTIILRDIVLAVGAFTIAAFILIVVVFTIALWAVTAPESLDRTRTRTTPN